MQVYSHEIFGYNRTVAIEFNPKTGVKTMATKAKKTEAKSGVTGKIQIPSAVRSGASALAGLTSSAKKSAVSEGKTKKSDRPVLNISEGVLEEWALCTELASHFETQAENAKSSFKDEAFEEYVAMMWDQKTQPKNPVAKSDKEGKADCEGQFIIQERYSIGGGTADELIVLLVDQNVNDSDARNLVKNELNFQPSVNLNLDQLLVGHYDGKEFIPATDEEQAVGQKIIDLLMNNLSDEERDLAIDETPRKKVKDGFLARVHQYAHSKEQLAGVFNVITPIKQAKGAKFGISDSPDRKSKRLLEKAAEILEAKLVD